MKVIKIGATWCSGCLVMKPRWQEIEKENPWLQTEFYDYDDSPALIDKYNVKENLPVAIFLNDSSEELKRFSGEVAKDELIAAIEEVRRKQ